MSFLTNPFRFAAAGGGGPAEPNTVLLVGPNGADGSTTFTDESGYSRGDATVTGSAAVDTDKAKFSASLLIPDQSSLISFPDSDDFNFAGEFTIEAWVLNDIAFSGQRTIFAHGHGSGQRSKVLSISNGNLAFYVSTNGSGWTLPNGSVAGWALNTWHHVAVDRDASNVIRLYADGAMIDNATLAGTLFNTNELVKIGDGFDNWRGNIEELRVSDVARYASNSGYTVPTARFPRTA